MPLPMRSPVGGEGATEPKQGSEGKVRAFGVYFNLLAYKQMQKIHCPGFYPNIRHAPCIGR